MTKPLLEQLVVKMDDVLNQQRELKAEISRVETTTTAEIGRVERELKAEIREVRQVAGITRTREIGRLDGRIDQLAQDVALGRNPTAAE